MYGLIPYHRFLVKRNMSISRKQSTNTKMISLIPCWLTKSVPDGKVYESQLIKMEDQHRQHKQKSRFIKMFPTTNILLTIVGTVAVTSSECERSGSVLNHFYSYLRTSTMQTGLSALAMKHTNLDVEFNIERVMSFGAEEPWSL